MHRQAVIIPDWSSDLSSEPGNQELSTPCVNCEVVEGEWQPLFCEHICVYCIEQYKCENCSEISEEDFAIVDNNRMCSACVEENEIAPKVILINAQNLKQCLAT